MSESFGDAMPWPYASGRDKGKTGETTSGQSDASRLVEVAVNLNPAEAAIIKGRLESQDIPAFVQQEAMGSVLGLTIGPLGSAKVLVPELLVEQALDILAETFELDELDEDAWDEDDWDDDPEFE